MRAFVKHYCQKNDRPSGMRKRPENRKPGRAGARRHKNGRHCPGGTHDSARVRRPVSRSAWTTGQGGQEPPCLFPGHGSSLVLGIASITILEESSSPLFSRAGFADAGGEGCKNGGGTLPKAQGAIAGAACDCKDKNRSGRSREACLRFAGPCHPGASPLGCHPASLRRAPHPEAEPARLHRCRFRPTDSAPSSSERTRTGPRLPGSLMNGPSFNDPTGPRPSGSVCLRLCLQRQDPFRCFLPGAPGQWGCKSGRCFQSSAVWKHPIKPVRICLGVSPAGPGPRAARPAPVFQYRRRDLFRFSGRSPDQDAQGITAADGVRRGGSKNGPHSRCSA